MQTVQGYYSTNPQITLNESQSRPNHHQHKNICACERRYAYILMLVMVA